MSYRLWDIEYGVYKMYINTIHIGINRCIM